MLTAIIGLISFVFGVLGGVWNFLGDFALWVFLRVGHIAVRDWAWRLPFVPWWAEEALFCFRWGALGGLAIEHIGNAGLSMAGAYLTWKTQKPVSFPKLDRSTNIVAMFIIAPLVFLVHQCYLIATAYWYISVPVAVIIFILAFRKVRSMHP